MDREGYIAANRAGWEEVAPLHRRQNLADLLEWFSTPGFSLLEEVETRRLTEIGVAGKAVIQVCCNNGRELVSVKNMGAGRCVGVDFAEAFIEQAREINAAAGQDCEFICARVDALPDDLRGQFHVAIVTIGVVIWMPDLDGFFRKVSSLLRSGGTLFIHEQHPILEMIEPGKAEDPVQFRYSYFRREPFVEEGGLDYYGGGKYAASAIYAFPQTMAEIVMAGLGAGLTLVQFEERPQHISNTWWNVEAKGPGLPMSYTLTYEKRQ
jgi:ubiquinone/menaquinone biosynthesis C-methylase UbiE